MDCAVGGRGGNSTLVPMELWCWEGVEGLGGVLCSRQENNCLTPLPLAFVLDHLNIRCNYALRRGVYGRGLNTGVWSGVAESPCHNSGGVRFRKSSLLTIGGNTRKTLLWTFCR